MAKKAITELICVNFTQHCQMSIRNSQTTFGNLLQAKFKPRNVILRVFVAGLNN